MDRRHVDQLLATDSAVLGRNLRSVRISRGLKQGALAEGIVSVGYISRIEAGHRRPDARVLQALADRLAVDVSELLASAPTVSNDDSEHVLLLDYAELRLKTGDAEDALRDVEQVLGAPAAIAGRLRRRALQLRAGCFEALGHLDRAIIDLEDLLDDPHVDIESIRAGIALSRCHREAGDLAQAIGSGQRVLDRLAAADLVDTDEAVQLTVTVAAAYFERGDVNFAIRLCQRALRQADQLDSRAGRAAAYWNASIMRSEQGHTAEAVELAREAICALDHGSDARNVARLQSQLGIYELRCDPPETASARRNLELAEEQFQWTSASVIDRARNALAIARADLLDGDIDNAVLRANQVLEVENLAATAAAEAHVILGQVHLNQGQTQKACEQYQAAVARLTALGADRSAAQLWFDLGDMLEVTGDTAGALDAYRRAAASTGLTHKPAHTTAAHQVL